MPAKKKPFRKLLPLPYPPKSFTIEEARRAIREVREEDQRAAQAEAAGKNAPDAGKLVQTRSAA
jgi:hypothetical protein